MKRIVALFINLVIVCGVVFSSNSDFILVIDAGHGGRDPGALRGNIQEKDITLAVALEFGRMVERHMSDVKVIYTRKNNVSVALDRRAEIANKNKANLFVSLHMNSLDAKVTTVSGAETFILGLARSAENLAVAKRENAVIKYEEDYTTKYEGFDPDSPESYIIFEFMTNQYMQQSLDVATYMQSEIKKRAKRVDRGVRQAGLLVLRKSAMPSILIEMGFINNPTEAKYLASTAGQSAMATSIYQGFKKYKDDFDKKGGHVVAKHEPTKQQVQQPTQQQVTQQKPVVQTQTRPADVVVRPAQTANAGETEYRVQFLYALHKLPENSAAFKGIVPTGYTVDNGYKYTVGNTTDFNEILRIQNQVRQQFSDAFVISIPVSMGEKINVAPVQHQQPTTTQRSATKPVTTTQPTASSAISAGAIEYRVQIIYSASKLSDNSPKFKGQKGISFYIDSGYKYTVGSTTNYNEIVRIHAEVRKKFSDAFIIQMKDGKRFK